MLSNCAAGSESGAQRMEVCVSRELRDGILEQLRQRNQRETHTFSHYEQAVEKVRLFCRGCQGSW
jgi:hypothetical protein